MSVHGTVFKDLTKDNIKSSTIFLKIKTECNDFENTDRINFSQ